MKTILALLPLISAAVAGQISATCRNFSLDPATEVLSAECKDGQGSNEAWKATSLNLNECLVYDDAQDKIFVSRKTQLSCIYDTLH
jgi:hypothetical protein